MEKYEQLQNSLKNRILAKECPVGLGLSAATMAMMFPDREKIQERRKRKLELYEEFMKELKKLDISQRRKNKLQTIFLQATF